jgi:hypothetical protein
MNMDLAGGIPLHRGWAMAIARLEDTFTAAKSVYLLNLLSGG